MGRGNGLLVNVNRVAIWMPRSVRCGSDGVMEKIKAALLDWIMQRHKDDEFGDGDIELVLDGFAAIAPVIERELMEDKDNGS